MFTCRQVFRLAGVPPPREPDVGTHITMTTFRSQGGFPHPGCFVPRIGVGKSSSQSRIAGHPEPLRLLHAGLASAPGQGAPAPHPGLRLTGQAPWIAGPAAACAELFKDTRSASQQFQLSCNITDGGLALFTKLQIVLSYALGS